MSNSLPDDAVPPPGDAPGQQPTVDETSAYTPAQDGAPSPARQASDPLIGTTIGRYQLLKKLGEGGMGSVYLALQSEPVKRQVALKLIKGGIDSRTVIARFEAERQALAVMDHPNIARIYDGGTTSGPMVFPYFVMELVQGMPITEFCDEQRLSPRERLELFVPICQAVQHAHQKGIIHRDLKPSNVLVTEVDGKPVPKVIDFGVAKATEQPLTDQTLGDTGAIVGTPAYMSPEQADPESMDIDTRTDIYALGVVLYELMTGSPPIDAKQFRRGALLEMLRMVLEEEPPRPSMKLSTAEALPSIAANRNIEPRQLQALLRGELDWIVMKAIEKDRGRRYETANGFAADVQRYLAGEAVLAHPPSRWYQLKKFVKRNRIQVSAASLVVLAMVAGLGVSLWQMNRAIVAEGVAKENEGTANAAVIAERQAKELAETNLAFSKKGNAILGSLFVGLDPVKIAESGRPLQDLLRENLHQAVKDLEGSAIGDPHTVALMQNTLAMSLVSLGDYPQAVKLMQRSHESMTSRLGNHHEATVVSRGNLAGAYLHNGQFKEALPLFEETLKQRREMQGSDHHETLTIMNNLAGLYQQTGQLQKALSLYQECLQLNKAKNGAEHPSTLTSMSNLGYWYVTAKQFDKAFPLLEEVVKTRERLLGIDHPITLGNMNGLGNAYRSAGSFGKALPILESTFKRAKATLGDDHPITLSTMSNLASVLRITNHFDRAVPLLEESLKLKKRKLGMDHPETLTGMNNLAEGYRATGQLDKALPLMQETLEKRKAKLGMDHQDTIMSINNLALGYQATGKLELALPLFEQSIKLMEIKQGKGNLDTIGMKGNLAKAYLDAHQTDKALPLIETFLESFGRIRGRQTLTFASVMTQVSLDLLKAHQYVPAEKYIRECLAIREKLPTDPWNMFNNQSMLGGALLGQKKYAEAEPLLLKAFEGMVPNLPKRTVGGDVAWRAVLTRLTEATDRLILLYTETNKPDEVKKWQAVRAKVQEGGPKPP